VAGAMKVTLKIYDSLGKLVAEPITNQMKSAGTYASDYFNKQLIKCGLTSLPSQQEIM